MTKNKTIIFSFLIPFLSLLILAGCSAKNSSGTQVNDIHTQKNRECYRPGLGEMMSTIQHHHTKLWFAGINKNWKLAEFEVNELEETFDSISALHGDEFDVGKLIPEIIKPRLKETSNAIGKKDLVSFKKQYSELSSGCNSCHETTGHEFIKIKTPTQPAFTDQVYGVESEK